MRMTDCIFGSASDRNYALIIAEKVSKFLTAGEMEVKNK